jgi:Zn-dependent protease with chaperone function
VSAVLALVGIVRPRIVVSQAAQRVLSAGQMEMALRHERAHAHSRDNLKRLLILLAPGAFPGRAALEQAWSRFAEWAADDCAAGGSAQESLTLAAALVHVAKLGTIGKPAPLMTAFLATSHDLEARVDRLLNVSTPNHPSSPRQTSTSHFLSVTAVLTAGIVVAAAMHPARIHSVLERLIH